MTAEELEQIRGRHRRVAEAVPEVPLSDHGLVAHADRYALLAEVDRLTAELAAARGENAELKRCLKVMDLIIGLKDERASDAGEGG